MERHGGCGPPLPARSQFWQSHWRFLKCLCPAPASAFVGLLWSPKPTFPRWVSWVSLDVLRVRALLPRYPLPRASGRVWVGWDVRCALPTTSPAPCPGKRSWTASVPTATRKLRKAGQAGQAGQGATRSCPWEHLPLAHTHRGAFGGRIALRVCVGWKGLAIGDLARVFTTGIRVGLLPLSPWPPGLVCGAGSGVSP